MIELISLKLVLLGIKLYLPKHIIETPILVQVFLWLVNDLNVHLPRIINNGLNFNHHVSYALRTDHLLIKLGLSVVNHLQNMLAEFQHSGNLLYNEVHVLLLLISTLIKPKYLVVQLRHQS